MAEQRLIDAFDDCIERLHSGSSLEDCLRDYPHLSAELRALIETGQLAGQAQYSTEEVESARQAVWEQIHRRQPFRRGRWASIQRGLALVASLLLVISVVLTLVVLNAEDTATPATITPTLTATSIRATDKPTPQPTATASTIPTEAPSEPSETPRELTSDSIAPTLDESLPTETTPEPSATSRELTSDSTASTADEPVPDEATPTPCTPEPPEEWVEYAIQSGDTLIGIAAARGISLDELLRANCLTAERLIFPGQLLSVPVTDSQNVPNVSEGIDEAFGNLDQPSEFDQPDNVDQPDDNESSGNGSGD